MIPDIPTSLLILIVFSAILFVAFLALLLGAWFGGAYTARQSYKHVTDAHADLLNRFSVLQEKYINLSEEHSKLKARLEMALQQIDKLSTELAELRCGDKSSAG
jgi:hypothetical protein